MSAEYPFNFYDLKNNRYLPLNTKPTLKNGKDFESLDELWEENSFLNDYNIEDFRNVESIILDIVNYKFNYDENDYLLTIAEVFTLCDDKFIKNYKEGIIDIRTIIGDILYNSDKELIQFLQIYYTDLMYCLYEEEFGGKSKILSYETDLYLENLPLAFKNIIDILI